MYTFQHPGHPVFCTHLQYLDPFHTFSNWAMYTIFRTCNLSNLFALVTCSHLNHLYLYPIENVITYVLYTLVAPATYTCFQHLYCVYSVIPCTLYTLSFHVPSRHFQHLHPVQPFSICALYTLSSHVPSRHCRRLYTVHKMDP